MYFILSEGGNASVPVKSITYFSAEINIFGRDEKPECVKAHFTISEGVVLASYTTKEKAKIAMADIIMRIQHPSSINTEFLALMTEAQMEDNPEYVKKLLSLLDPVYEPTLSILS